MQPIAITATRVGVGNINIYHILRSNGTKDPISEKAAKEQIIKHKIQRSIACIENGKPKIATYYLNK